MSIRMRAELVSIENPDLSKKYEICWVSLLAWLHIADLPPEADEIALKIRINSLYVVNAPWICRV